MARPVYIEPGDIIDAARKCIQQRGLAATTLKDVAAEAGVTQGTVYYHFKTKEELMLSALKSSIYEYMDLVQEAWVEAEDPAAKVASAMDVSRESYGKRDNLHRLVYNMVAYGLQNEQAFVECEKLIRRSQQTIEGYCLEIQSSLGRSCLPPPGPLSRIIYAFLLGLSLQSLFDKGTDVDGAYDSFKRMLLDLMRCQQGERR